MTKDLHEMSVEELGRLFPVILTEHQGIWKQLFIEEKSKISEIIGTSTIFRIEHIGSTSIPGIIAKPTIDILLEIQTSSILETIINAFKTNGYNYIPQPKFPPPHMMFNKGYTIRGFEGQVYHIHVRYPGDWDELFFRDFLIKNPSVAKEYEQLKIKLQSEFRNNREAYTEGKGEFVCRISKLARDQLGNCPTL